jgi:hypothetical protein
MISRPLIVGPVSDVVFSMSYRRTTRTESQFKLRFKQDRAASVQSVCNLIGLFLRNFSQW